MSNALESASLIMYPSGYSNGVLGSLKPTDGSGDFTFTRGSNLSATRVGPNGYIEKGYENLLLQSNSFTTSPWVAIGTSVTGGQAGYDGSNDAWLLEASSTGSSRYAFQDISTSGVNTFSLYAKAGTSDYIRIQINASSTSFAYFDISAGTAGTTLNDIDTDIEDVGSGWYRCSLTMNNSSITAVRIYVAALNSVSVTAGDNVYIQDAMLNQGLVAYPYIETTTAPVAGGILEDEPRIDFSDGCGHLLLEPSRTNLIPYSEYIDGLGLTDLTTTPNATTSPEGLQNAYKVLTGTAGSEQIESSHTGTSGNTKTQSVYIKADSGVQWIRLIQIRNGFANSASAWFDIQNGVKGSKEENGTTSVVDDATKIEDAGNGWYRLTLVCTDSTNNTIFDTRVRTAIADNSATRVSNGSYFVWGFQLEQDATYPTSYIPTYGVSQTRLSDFFDSSADFTNFFGNNQGTIYIETDKRLFENYSTNEEFIGFRDDTKNWRIIGSQSIIFIQCVNWGATIAHYPSTTNPTKYLFKWDGSNVSFYIDGSLIGSATQTAAFNPNQFGRTGNGVSMRSQEFLKQFTIFPTALSDDECIALTSL